MSVASGPESGGGCWRFCRSRKALNAIHASLVVTILPSHIVSVRGLVHRKAIEMYIHSSPPLQLLHSASGGATSYNAGRRFRRRSIAMMQTTSLSQTPFPNRSSACHASSSVNVADARRTESLQSRRAKTPALGPFPLLPDWPGQKTSPLSIDFPNDNTTLL